MMGTIVARSAVAVRRRREPSCFCLRTCRFALTTTTTTTQTTRLASFCCTSSPFLTTTGSLSNDTTTTTTATVPVLRWNHSASTLSSTSDSFGARRLFSSSSTFSPAAAPASLSSSSLLLLEDSLVEAPKVKRKTPVQKENSSHASWPSSSPVLTAVQEFWKQQHASDDSWDATVWRQGCSLVRDLTSSSSSSTTAVVAVDSLSLALQLVLRLCRERPTSMEGVDLLTRLVRWTRSVVSAKEKSTRATTTASNSKQLLLLRRFVKDDLFPAIQNTCFQHASGWKPSNRYLLDQLLDLALQIHHIPTAEQWLQLQWEFCQTTGSASSSVSSSSSQLLQQQQPSAEGMENPWMRPDHSTYRKIIEAWFETLQQQQQPPRNKNSTSEKRSSYATMKSWFHPQASMVADRIERLVENQLHHCRCELPEKNDFKGQGQWQKRQESLAPTQAEYVLWILACSKIPGRAGSDRATKVLQTLQQQNDSSLLWPWGPSTAIYNAVLYTYSLRPDCLEQAEALLREMCHDMHRRQQQQPQNDRAPYPTGPDTQSFTMVISALTRKQHQETMSTTGGSTSSGSQERQGTNQAGPTAADSSTNQNCKNSNRTLQNDRDNQQGQSLIPVRAEQWLKLLCQLSEQQQQQQQQKRNGASHDNDYQGPHYLLKPNAAVVTAVLDCWAKSSSLESAPLRAESILRRMIPIMIQNATMSRKRYAGPLAKSESTRQAASDENNNNDGDNSEIWNGKGHDNDYDQPTTAMFNAAMNAWSRSSLAEAPDRVEQLWHELLSLRQERERARDIVAANMLTPNKITYMARINAWERSRRTNAAEQAWKVLQEMLVTAQGSNPHVNFVVAPPTALHFNRVLWAWAQQGNALQAQAILEYMMEHSRPYQTAAPHSRSQVQDLRQQAQVLIPAPDLSSFNFVLAAWSKSGLKEAGEGAEAILRRMQHNQQHGASRIAPDLVSYNTVLSCWARNVVAAKAAHRSVQLVLEMMDRYDKGQLQQPPDNITLSHVFHVLVNSPHLSATEKDAMARDILARLEPKKQQQQHRPDAGGKIQKHAPPLLLFRPTAHVEKLISKCLIQQ